MLTIGVDFDGTYGADPETFRKVVDAFLDAGHTVILITQRAEHQGQECIECINGQIPIVWASGQEKRVAALEAGYAVDIWIEDNPAAVYTPFIYRGL